jgi:hypothetical protein
MIRERRMGDYGNEIKDIAGYAASALVLTTFMMTSFRWLRVSAILSNVAFILYGSLAGLPPILVLHSILLPLNVYRLAQLERVQA